MNSSPNFRSIGAPLDVDDAELDSLNRSLGVPTLVPVATTELPPKPGTPPRTPVKAVNVHLPNYAVDSLKARAFETGASVRFIVMKALHDAGITIEPVDLVEDARRTR
jgi:hypothetical protein